MLIPPVLIIGPSGTGKSTSIQNLPKDKTCILNIEKKVLPFREALEFTHNKMIEDSIGLEDEFVKAVKDPKIENIVIESWNRYSDKVVELGKKLNQGNGHATYSIYADKVTKFISTVMNTHDKYIFFTALPEVYNIESPDTLKKSRFRASFHGNLLEKMGGVESFFTIVLYSETTTKLDGQNKVIKYQFVTNRDEFNSAKSPQGMFDFNIPNDLKLVKEKLKAYYKIEDPKPMVMTP